jgi:ankyrin repeat protein
MMTGILDLPVEIILLIIDSLLRGDEQDPRHQTCSDFRVPQGHLNSLVQTNKRFYLLLQDRLYEHNAKCCGQTALAFGLFHGQQVVVQKTLEICSPNLKIPLLGWTRDLELHHEPFCWAAQGGQIAMIDFLLESGATLSERCKGYECYPELLGQAAKNGHLDTMKHLVEKGVPLESRRILKQFRGGSNRRCMTPFRLAAENGHKHCISFILDHWNSNQMSFESKEYVHRVALIVPATVRPPGEVNHDTLECALFILKRTEITSKRDFCRCGVEPAVSLSKDLAELNQTLAKPGNLEQYGEMLLYLAAITGCVPLVEEMIRLGIPVERRFRGGNTALCLAALEGGPLVAKRLLELGADLNVRNAQGQSPLFLATLSWSMAVMQVLLDHDADINAPSTRCGIVQTPLWRAVADYSRPKRNRNAPSHTGRSQSRDIAPFLLQNGADPNICDPTFGVYPLWLVFNVPFPEGDRTSLLRELLERGADVHKAERGHSLLWCAVRKHSTDTVKLLLDHGSNPNHYGKDFDGTKTYYHGEPRSPLAKAMKFHREEIAELLLDYGADPHALCWKEETCLVKATMSMRPSLVEKMIDKGVDVNETFQGKTALHVAVWKKHAEMVELLLRRGADANITVGGTSIVSPISIHTWAFWNWRSRAGTAHTSDVNDIADLLIAYGARNTAERDRAVTEQSRAKLEQKKSDKDTSKMEDFSSN